MEVGRFWTQILADQSTKPTWSPMTNMATPVVYLVTVLFIHPTRDIDTLGLKMFAQGGLFMK